MGLRNECRVFVLSVCCSQAHPVARRKSESSLLHRCSRVRQSEQTLQSSRSLPQTKDIQKASRGPLHRSPARPRRQIRECEYRSSRERDSRRRDRSAPLCRSPPEFHCSGIRLQSDHPSPPPRRARGRLGEPALNCEESKSFARPNLYVSYDPRQPADSLGSWGLGGQALNRLRRTLMCGSAQTQDCYARSSAARTELPQASSSCRASSRDRF